MISVIKPILLAFLMSRPVRQLVVDLLAAYAKRSDNKVDDYAVNLIRQELFDEEEGNWRPVQRAA